MASDMDASAHTTWQGPVSQHARTSLVSYVTRELLYQGYVASRLTGVTPSNMRRAIGSANRSKYIMGFPFAFLLLLIVAEARFLPGTSYVFYPIGVLTWTFMPVFLSVMQISYGASAGPQIREALLTLPLSEQNVRDVASGALISSLRIPLIVSFAILLLAGLILGPWMMLAGIISAAISSSVALMAVSAIVRVYRRLGATSRLSTVVRIITVMPVVLLSLTIGYVQSSTFHLTPFQETYVPLLNLAGVAQGSVVSLLIALAYAIPVSLLGFLALNRTSLALLSPMTFLSGKVGKFKAKIHTPTVALILSDFRQMLRSPRLVGFIVVPFIYVIITIYSNFVSSQSGAAEPPQALFLTSVLPVAAVSSFLAYVLYLTELRGLSYFLTLPLGRFTNIKSKLTVAALFYGASAALMGAAFAGVTRDAYVLLPLAAFLLPVVACVLYTALYFQYTIRTLAVGVVGVVNTMVYTVLNLLVFGVPAGAYIVGLFLYGNFVAPVPYLAGLSAVEILILVVLVRKAS